MSTFKPREFFQEYYQGKSMTVDQAINTFYTASSQHKEKCLKAMDPIMQDSDLAFAVGGLCYHLKYRNEKAKVMPMLNKWLKGHADDYRTRLKGTKDQEERIDLQVTISELSHAMQKISD